jgi:uncharacterized cupin superfamily protein
MPDAPTYLLRADAIAAGAATFSHPWNPASEVRGAMLARATGLRRTGVNLARLAPGKESFTPHAHQREEEWIYILSGRGVALIGAEEVEVGAGDFLGFPAPQPVHHMRNPGPEDLVYLMGGEIAAFDAVDFPVQKKRLVRIGDDTRVYDAGGDDPSGHPDAESFAAARARALKP